MPACGVRGPPTAHEAAVAESSNEGPRSVSLCRGGRPLIHNISMTLTRRSAPSIVMTPPFPQKTFQQHSATASRAAPAPLQDERMLDLRLEVLHAAPEVLRAWLAGSGQPEFVTVVVNDATQTCGKG